MSELISRLASYNRSDYYFPRRSSLPGYFESEPAIKTVRFIAPIINKLLAFSDKRLLKSKEKMI